MKFFSTHKSSLLLIFEQIFKLGACSFLSIATKTNQKMLVPLTLRSPATITAGKLPLVKQYRDTHPPSTINTQLLYFSFDVFNLHLS